MERRLHNFSGPSDFKLLQLTQAWFLSRKKHNIAFEKFIECRKLLRANSAIIFYNYDTSIDNSTIEQAVEQTVKEFVQEYTLLHPDDKHVDEIDLTLYRSLLEVVPCDLAARMEAADEKYVEFLEGNEIKLMK